MKKVVAFILVIIAIAGAAFAWWLYFRHPNLTVDEFQEKFVRGIESELRKPNHPLRQAIEQRKGKLVHIKVTGVACKTKDNSNNAGRKGNNIKSIDIRILAKADRGAAEGLFVYQYLLSRIENEELKIEKEGIIREVKRKKGTTKHEGISPIDSKMLTEISHIVFRFGVDLLIACL